MGCTAIRKLSRHGTARVLDGRCVRVGVWGKSNNGRVLNRYRYLDRRREYLPGHASRENGNRVSVVSACLLFLIYLYLPCRVCSSSLKALHMSSVNCDSGGGATTYTGLRIASVFIIWGTSTFGATFPIVGHRSRVIRVPPLAFEYACVSFSQFLFLLQKK